MKRSTLIALISLAIGFGLLLSFYGSNISIYTDFQTAQKKQSEVHVIGTWVKRDQAFYDAQKDIFQFYLQDSLGKTALVQYHDPKPANFEQAKKIVVIGKYEGNVFKAKKILQKCPSKYKNASLTESPH